ncbi:energy transducer TonB [Pseudomonas sp. MS19]|uniref:energy transducer TonB n=1 Tax=Pseudomonas sp. MS19 TaxID=2579939 RepID=UPI00156245EC|nr:energy transducer TonB [Pseudomonas sp. MS19]NRH28621.1 energy transducer TonB [Pseudomonas sp. MS19]
MIPELRRRAYLSAMQVATWLPRGVLPFAAPSRPELLEVLPVEPEMAATPTAEPVAQQRVQAAETAEREPARPVATAQGAAGLQSVRAQLEGARPQTPARNNPPANDDGETEKAEATTEVSAKPVAVQPPRFALQLLKAGACHVLVELPTGEALQGRDPAYLLLKDLLRAADLPDSPQIIGEPVRWPLLSRGNMDQGPAAALEFVQSFTAARIEEQGGCSCLWLVGLPAIRFAGDAHEDAYNRELQVEGVGAAWALPGLELLMDEPARKAELWQAMRRVRQRWMSQAE